ncbi:MAG: hypothetical protein K0U84_10155 [Actinomycetia bacterium]|nr:hypothetical protein [Actinomycetes bacterium]
MGGVLAVVVALVVGLVVWKSTSNQGAGATAQSDAGVDRTVGVLREKDPVCDEWLNYTDELSQAAEQWTALDRSVPATKWTPEHREIYVAVREAMTTAADQFESILPEARNVLLQELIAQTIVYLRAYVERIPEYVESDSLIAGVAAKFSNAVTGMCEMQPQLRASGSAEKTMRSSVPEPAALTPFMADENPACPKFLELITRQKTYLSAWAKVDSTLPAEQWTPAQRALNNAAREVMLRDAKDIRAIAEVAEGTIMADLLVARAAYMQAYAEIIPTYMPNDKFLWSTGTSIGGGLAAACEATL